MTESTTTVILDEQGEIIQPKDEWVDFSEEAVAVVQHEYDQKNMYFSTDDPLHVENKADLFQEPPVDAKPISFTKPLPNTNFSTTPANTEPPSMFQIFNKNDLKVEDMDEILKRNMPTDSQLRFEQRDSIPSMFRDEPSSLPKPQQQNLPFKTVVYSPAKNDPDEQPNIESPPELPPRDSTPQIPSREQTPQIQVSDYTAPPATEQKVISPVCEKCTCENKSRTNLTAEQVIANFEIVIRLKTPM